MEEGSLGVLKQAALDSVNGTPEPEAKPLGSYSRDDVRLMLEDILNQDSVEREIKDTAENVAAKMKESMWPEFDLEAKKLSAQKKVERKALLMHLKELMTAADG